MEGELQKVVGRNLRLYRSFRGVSQEAFAERLGVHRTYMGAIERGERNLSLRSLERLAETLDLDPLELLTELRDQDSAPDGKQ
ncbi:XRE family transcriptional regulator [Leucobacter muris]|uniref:XRE family transcriptional regulator n=1 Tax=Leucobacter muris TaxID=1935379 RepID=A0ABX5QFC0_9MICO|nr:XRE family transcriptional regulator [Leucobacter muris]